MSGFGVENICRTKQVVLLATYVAQQANTDTLANTNIIIFATVLTSRNVNRKHVENKYLKCQFQQ